jgi:DNA-binding transcriptional LysR family regulator
MSLREFVAREHVLVSIAGDDVGFVDHLLRKLGHTRRVAVTVPTFDDAARMVAETDLVATLPASVVRQSPHALAWSTPPFAVPALDVVMVWHPRTTTSAKHKWLRDVVTHVWRGTDLGRARART